MWFEKNGLVFYVLLLISLFELFIHCHGWSSFRNYNFVVRETSYTRLCKTKKILTVNGKFPGPTIYAHKGEPFTVTVYNKGKHNITIHWHGVKQPRYPWSDGPEYITQCPIQSGNVFKQKVVLSMEEGTLWWHAHSDWSRATVHGPIVILPKHGTGYPFPKPHKDVPIVLGQWWKQDLNKVYKIFLKSGGGPNISDAFTINGQPGDFYPCSKQETFKLSVEHGKTYLLRIINAALNEILFFAIANHNLTAVNADAEYTKPLTKGYMVISPGQTLDCLLHANQHSGQYYMAARAYSTNPSIAFDNTTTTAILQYTGQNYPSNFTPILPSLPYYNDTTVAFNVLAELKSLATKGYPLPVPCPTNVSTKLLFTVAINTFPCANNSQLCEGPNTTRLAASVNNISFVTPSFAILEAYYEHINGVYTKDFPDFPPLVYNYTADYLSLELELAERGTKVNVLEYNSTVELVFQGTNVAGSAIDHPMHLHGYSFFIVGYGFGNFDKEKDPLTYNLVDPPMRNTVVVPKNGWTAVRFKATNPGVWFMHCHLERHLSWGMDMAFIVKNGKHPVARLLPPPPDMPPC